MNEKFTCRISIPAEGQLNGSSKDSKNTFVRLNLGFYEND